MAKKYDAVALGELLIDFTESGRSAQGNPLLEVNPGGAPGNVLSMLQNYGEKTAFIGKVGNDMFGHFLLNVVGSAGIDTHAIVTDPEVKTTLAFVHTHEDGDRDFYFYRDPGADMMLTKEEVDVNLLRNTRLFHFGTLSSTHPGVREATRYAIEVAKDAGAMVSFDPNFREMLWKSPEDAKKEITYGFSKCDMLKIADNEVELMCGTDDYDKGARMLFRDYHIPLILITLGKKGSRAYYKDIRIEEGPFLREDTIETTGAGDTFCATAIHFLLKYSLEGLDKDKLKELLIWANAAASLITTRKGALRVMPSKDEVEALVKTRLV